MESTVVRPQFITSVTVNPGQTLVVITVDAVLVLQADGSWTRTPLKGPQDLAAMAQDLAYKRLVIDHVEVRQDLAKAKRDLAAYELDLAAPLYRWHRKGGEDCDVHRN